MPIAQPESASRPVVKTIDVLQSPEAFESMTGYRSTPAADEETSVILDRRKGVSDLERASRLLIRAIQYLTYEQRNGKVTSVPANRKAIAVLCGSLEQIAHVERREPAKSSLRAWLGSLRTH